MELRPLLALAVSLVSASLTSLHPVLVAPERVKELRNATNVPLLLAGGGILAAGIAGMAALTQKIKKEVRRLRAMKAELRAAQASLAAGVEPADGLAEKMAALQRAIASRYRVLKHYKALRVLTGIGIGAGGVGAFWVSPASGALERVLFVR